MWCIPPSRDVQIRTKLSSQTSPAADVLHAMTGGVLFLRGVYAGINSTDV